LKLLRLIHNQNKCQQKHDKSTTPTLTGFIQTGENQE